MGKININYTTVIKKKKKKKNRKNYFYFRDKILSPFNNHSYKRKFVVLTWTLIITLVRPTLYCIVHGKLNLLY